MLDQRQKIESIFAEAVQMQTAADRVAYLDAACGDDAALRDRVEALLQARQDAGSFLERPAARFVTTLAVGEARSAPDCPNHEDLHEFLCPNDQPGCLGTIGHYEITEVVGRGGMGVVLKGYDPKLKRVVAIKVLAPELACNASARQRFLREGQAAAAISHDHVVTIYAIDDSGPLPFIAMEYISGQSLEQKIDERGALELKQILRIGKQAASALAAAHAEGLIHRDIKPANLLLENGVERVKITDFGLARAVDDVRVTKPGTVTGTPAYMSPEQARSEAVDHRSDLFSLGCVLYAMCTGRSPFRAETTVAMIRRVCDDQPRAIHEINPEIPDWLARLVERLLAKEPGERFQSASEVEDLLGRYLAHVQQPAAVELPRLPEFHSATVRRKLSTRGRTWATAAAVLLALFGGIGFTEATGLTDLTGTVIRVVRGDGTLVVEVDDPNIQVLIDGEELVITGAGPKEIRLRPGKHEVHAVEDGKPIETKLVTITRGGREVVKVTREEATAKLSSGPMNRRVWAGGTYTTGDVSADGRYFAFTDWASGDLAIRDLGTGQNRRLTKEGSEKSFHQFALSPRFSTDGKQIAYTWFNKDDKYDLRVIDLDRGDPKVVFLDAEKPRNGYPTPIGFARDGTSVVFLLSDRDTHQVSVVSLTDGSLRTVKTFPREHVRFGQMVLAPDGRTVAYSRTAKSPSDNRDVYLLDVADGRETQVTNRAGNKDVLAWTHQGRGLLFTVEAQGVRDAWIVRAAGGTTAGEPRLVKADVGNIEPQGLTREGALYYAVNFGGPSIFIADLDLDGGTLQAQPLEAEKYSVADQFFIGDWSPDGKHLAYKTMTANKVSQIRILSLSSGHARALRPKLSYLSRFYWSADGRSFISASRKDWGDAGIGTYQIDADDGEITTIVEPGNGAAPGSAQLSPDGNGVYYVKAWIGLVYRELKSGSEREILSPDTSPFDKRIGVRFDVSPDGQQIVVSGKEAGKDAAILRLISTRDRTSSELLRLSNEGEPGWISFTPDGQFVVFNRYGKDKKPALWYVSSKGGEPRKLDVSGMEGNVLGIQHFAIHPDGKQMAITSLGNRKSELWVLENFLPPLEKLNSETAADFEQSRNASGPVVRQAWANATDNTGGPSPDGRYLAFVDWATGDLAIRDLATGQNRRLTNKGTWNNSSEFALSPRFSPDAKSIAYMWFSKEDRHELRVIGVEGGEIKVIHVEPGATASAKPVGWMADGKSLIADLGARSQLVLASIAVDGGSPRVIKSFDRRQAKVGHIALAPYGSFVAYSRLKDKASGSRDLFLLNVESDEETQVTQHAADEDVLAWSPEGRRLIFRMARQGTWDAWSIGIADGKPQGSPQLIKPDIGTLSPLGMTRDGTFFYGLELNQPSIFTAALDLREGTATPAAVPEQQLLVMERSGMPAWSPDGQFLAYKSRTQSGDQRIMIVAPKTGELRVLEPKVVGIGSFGWEPDGKSFLAVTTRERDQPSRGIDRIDATTGELTTIVPPTGQEAGLEGHQRWSHDGSGIYFVRGKGIVYRDLRSGAEKAILAEEKSIFDERFLLDFDVSRDGQKLAVCGYERGGKGRVLRVISIAEDTSRELVRMPDEGASGRRTVAWLPDGQSLLFIRWLSPDESQNGLWRMPADGGEPQKIDVRGVKRFHELAVHPDGKQIAFAAQKARTFEVWVLENFLTPMMLSAP